MVDQIGSSGKNHDSAGAGGVALRGKKPAGSGKKLQDRTLDALNASAELSKNVDLAALSKDVEGDLESFLEALAAKIEESSPETNCEDTCDNPDQVVAPYCSQWRLDKKKAASRSTKAKAAATLDFQTAVETWSQAVSQHEYDVSTAESALRSAVEEARKAYEDKKNKDSFSRNLYRYHTMREALATAVQAYQGAMATAASTLAAEAGNLLSAHTDAIAAISKAQAIQVVDEAVADQTFWQSVETARDTA